VAAGYVQNLTSVTCNLHIYGYVSLEISEFIFSKLQWFVLFTKIKMSAAETKGSNWWNYG